MGDKYGRLVSAGLFIISSVMLVSWFVFGKMQTDAAIKEIHRNMELLHKEEQRLKRMEDWMDRREKLLPDDKMKELLRK